MLKRFAYIVLLLIFAPRLSFAAGGNSVPNKIALLPNEPLQKVAISDTTKKQKQQQEDEKKKIKEISKAKRLAKPEKIDDDAAPVTEPAPVKTKRQRRPDGMERPPEIPRRNEN